MKIQILSCKIQQRLLWKVWAETLGAYCWFEDNKDKEALNTIKSLLEFDIFPPLTGQYYQNGLVWCAACNGFNEVFQFLLQSDNLKKQSLDDARKNPTDTLFQLDLRNPLFSFFNEQLKIETLKNENGLNIFQYWLTIKDFINKQEMLFTIEHPLLVLEAKTSIMQDFRFIDTKEMSVKDIPKEIQFEVPSRRINTEKFIVYLEKKNLEKNLNPAIPSKRVKVNRL